MKISQVLGNDIKTIEVCLRDGTEFAIEEITNGLIIKTKDGQNLFAEHSPGEAIIRVISSKCICSNLSKIFQLYSGPHHNVNCPMFSEKL